MAAIGFPNVTIISNLNETPLLHGGSNSLLSTPKDLGFGVDANDVAKHHGVNKYIHYGYWVIPTNFDKALMFVTIWEPTQWDIDNLTCIILTSDNT